MSKPYRVIQWATGKNGQALMRAVINHPELELVGCKVFSDEKHGVDAGTIAGVDPIGVAATKDRREILAQDADVVLHVPLLNPDRTAMDRDIIELLRSGKNVIELTGSTSYPPALGADFSRPFENACSAGGSTLYGSGLNPGFILERLVPTVSGLCAEVDAITVTETYDCSHANADMVFGAMGFGKSPDEWSAESPFARLFTRLFTQALHVAAINMGIDIDHVSTQYDVTAADSDIQLDAGLLSKGTVCRVDNAYTVVSRRPDDVRLVKRTAWRCDNPISDANQQGFDENSGWTIEVEGTPGLVFNLNYADPAKTEDHSALHVGSAIAAIPEVCTADPGILLPTIFAPYRRHF